MFKEYTKLKIGIIIFIAMIGLVFLLANGCQNSKEYVESCKSIAKDYNGEMQALIDKKSKCRTISQKQRLLKDIQKFMERYDELNSDEKCYIDRKLYGDLIGIRQNFNGVIEIFEASDEDAKKLDQSLEDISEDIDVVENSEQLDKIIKKFYSLPEEKRYSMKNYRKFKNIESKYDSYLASKIDDLIDKLGEVEDTTAYKMKLDNIVYEHSKLRIGARYKVKKFMEYSRKYAEYIKLHANNSSGGRNEKNN